MIPVRIQLQSPEVPEATWWYASTKKGVVKLDTSIAEPISLRESFPFLRDEGRAEIYFALLLDRIEKRIQAIISQADFDGELITGYEVVIQRIYLEPLDLAYFHQRGAFPNLETLTFEYLVLGYTQHMHIKDPQAIMMGHRLQAGDFIPGREGDETAICQQIVESLCAPLLPVEECCDQCNKLATDSTDEMRDVLQGAVFTIRFLQASLDRLFEIKHI